MITLTIPNDDTVALRQFGKALIEIASEKDGHPVDVTVTPLVISTNVEERLRAATETLQQAAPQMMGEPEVDTTAQQVESLSGAASDSPIITVNPTCHALSNEELQERGFDSTGTPWDERIHSASKALNADGTWRLRRKPKDMDEEQWVATIQRVQDELRFPQEPVPVTPSGEELCIDEGCDHHGTPHICVTPEPPVTPPGDDYHTDTVVVTEQTVVGIPPLPVPPPPPVTTATLEMHLPIPPQVIPVTVRVVDDVQWDFPRLMTFLTERHGKIDVATVNTLLAQDGMSSVQELNAHPDKIGPFVARVKAHLGE